MKFIWPWKLHSSGCSFWLRLPRCHEQRPWIMSECLVNARPQESNRWKGFFWPSLSCWFDRWKYFVLRGTLWHIQFWQLPEAELSDLTQAVNFQLFIDTTGWKMGDVSTVQTCWEIQGKPINDIIWISDFSYDINYFKIIMFIECLKIFFFLIGHLKSPLPKLSICHVLCDHSDNSQFLGRD